MAYRAGASGEAATELRAASGAPRGPGGKEAEEGRKFMREFNARKSDPETERRSRKGMGKGGRERLRLSHLPKYAASEVVVLQGQITIPEGGHRAGVDGIGAMLLHKQAQGRVRQGLGKGGKRRRERGVRRE